MHCHLASCIKEFGPMHSFWLFPFERYNDILESQPTNNRSIELQLMRRFQTDNLYLHLHRDIGQMQTIFCKHFQTHHMILTALSSQY